MDTSFRKTSLVSLQIGLLLIAAVLFILYMPDLGNVTIEGSLLIALALFISLFAGMRAGLFTALVILFLFGSLYFWNLFFRPTDQMFLFSEATLLQFGVWLIVFVILSGSIYARINQLNRLNLSLQEKVRRLVSIDEETGLDNKERFELELQLEINRTNRHGESFTVLLYQIDYFTEFKRLYGDEEATRFLTFFSERLHQSTRTTDKKFRLSTEEFALILPYASESDMMIILNRFRQLIGDYELSNGKTVSFTNHIAHYTVTKEAKIESPDDVLGLLRNELKSYAL
ncbi:MULTISPECIES: diguanylate cyclase [unclassified Exiguobacterium]|uniref:GGDEF domain-containing protein n=1 Tax=unclassified Exiguobacterium TaxID=2644629 RepID=UPI001BEA0E42|nr:MULTISPECIES: diguanylate cyclase [unclassified Exiguobacterium]